MSKILIAVPTCHARFYGEPHGSHQNEVNTRTDWVRDTWHLDWKAKYQDWADCFFFYGRGATREPLPDEVFLDCGDGYFDLTEKIRDMYRWVLDHGYDFILKCDDDMIIRLDKIVTQFKPYDYYGSRHYNDSLCFTYAAGFSYWLSRKAMQVVVDSPLPENQDVSRYEDRTVGYLLEKAGIELVSIPKGDVLDCFCPGCSFKSPNPTYLHVERPEKRAEFWRQYSHTRTSNG